MSADNYSRNVSSEEARQGYLMVLKDRLGFFPPPGETFDLTVAGLTRKARIESYPCACRGPELPHEHYFIRVEGLKHGQRVAVRRSHEKTSGYALEATEGTRRSR